MSKRCGGSATKLKNNWLSVLSGRRSIRFRMLWTFVASLSAGMGASIAIPTGMIFGVPASVLAFFVSFAAVFFWLTRSTIAHLRMLSEGLGRIAGGNLAYRIPAGRQDELGVVAEHINVMAGQLEQLIEKERQAEKAKMELITGVSHDLRTPLTSLIGYLELLKGKAFRDEGEYDRFVGNTHSKALQLKDLIDELFEYARLVQGPGAEMRIVDLRKMLNQLLVEIEPLARSSGLSVIAELPEAPLFVRLDPEQVRRAVDNLLMNALKFSLQPGTIAVLLTQTAGRAVISVENEGEPITKEQEARLFERFYKTDESRTNRSGIPGGAGLGLAIVRGIAELHGGRATVVHENGRFRFSVELPHEAAK